MQIRHCGVRLHGHICSRVAVFTLKRPIGFFLDKPGPRGQVDRLLQSRALVVEPIDATRELDEGAAKVTTCIAIADCVLNVPKLRIHPFKLGAELVQHRAIYVVETDGTQCLELVHDIHELDGVLNALGLYFEDCDLVHQLADRDRHQDVLERAVLRGAHSFSWALAVVSLARCTAPPVTPTPKTYSQP